MRHQQRWTVEKIERRLALIAPLVFRKRAPLPPLRMMRLDDPLAEAPVDVDADTDGWTELPPGTRWGRPGQNFILRSTFIVPVAWGESGPVALHLPIGTTNDFCHPEALAYIDGAPLAAVDRFHHTLLLPEKYCDGVTHSLALPGFTGVDRFDSLLMGAPAVVQIDALTQEFIAAARVALGAAQHLAADHPARGRLLNALDAAFKALDTREPLGEVFYAGVPAALAALRDGIAQAGPPLDVTITGAGHAHIDVAWLWTLGQTRQKSRRTFYTVLRLMEEFPGYRFTQSQPQLYDYVRQDDPALFDAIKARVAEGRWEPIGGMWVEADCNLSGGESLARQFLLGRAFFREHFGAAAESPVLWLPDVFGYSAALPQLIRSAGLDYFFTTKISWNQFNQMPYDSFWWRGIDGTAVLTHLATTPDAGYPRPNVTYNADPTPETALGTWRQAKQKSDQAHFLMSYGWGDGGGGPTREMLENIREMAAFPGLPRMGYGRVIDFFRALEADSGDMLPTWVGELYLEYHRGTYTTQARNKRANRKSEFLLHDAEFTASLAARLDADYVYPAEALHTAWELVALNQFHDIIPGSSIGPVYVESLAQYEDVQQAALAVRDDALRVIAAHVGGDVVIVNPTTFPRDDLVFWPGDIPTGQRLLRPDGAPVYAQPVEGGTWLAAGEVRPYGALPLRMDDVQTAPPADPVTATPTLLENAQLRVEFNAAGDITRIYDKVHAREVLPPEQVANRFQAFEDRPLRWDAWDVDIFYDDQQWGADPAQSVQVVEGGPLRATLEITRRILSSTITQRISLAYNSPRLDFETRIDWQERHMLLKVAFPVAVLSPQAAYEIQWGHVTRPTHHNTSWDWARFEVPAQKWIDLSEGGYGVSLLNDGKYGHDVRDNVLRLSLLRSPTYPDPEADQGEHHVVYSLLPHADGLGTPTIAAAYTLNDPLLVTQGRGREPVDPPVAASFVWVDAPHVVIETVKQAEDGRGLILRLYESQGRRGTVMLHTGFPLAGAWRTNLIEEDESALPVDDDGRRLSLAVRPFEIITLRLL